MFTLDILGHFPILIILRTLADEAAAHVRFKQVTFAHGIDFMYNRKMQILCVCVRYSWALAGSEYVIEYCQQMQIEVLAIEQMVVSVGMSLLFMGQLFTQSLLSVKLWS